MTIYDPVDPKVSFPELEERILAWWGEADIFARSLRARADAPTWLFYEGPPTANGKPGIHHVEPRTFKDVYPRYKTMTGHLVRRKGGWDCHGLPVELEVEKEIGTTGKRDIEAFGVAAFNERCRASVQRYVGEFERLTERIGFWIDMSDAYWTMSTPYIESVWWSLKRLHQRGLLVEDHKVTAYCPRCGTALSDAEVAQGYEQVEDPSVFLRFPIVEAADRDLVGASLVGVDDDAVDAAVEHRRGGRGRRRLPGARARRRAADRRRRRWPARPRRGLERGRRRRRPHASSAPGTSRRTRTSRTRTRWSRRTSSRWRTARGSSTSRPPSGPRTSRSGAPRAGRCGDRSPTTAPSPSRRRRSCAGSFVKDADPAIIEDLRARGVLIGAGTYEHAYPFCWRCRTPLLYFARTSWYVRTTAVKDRLLAVNDGVHWYPEHIQHGRFGNWLENNVDWALSRERYWGTPLPIWRCAEGHETGDRLADRALRRSRGATCTTSTRIARSSTRSRSPARRVRRVATRVPEVIDAWYDSGAMPFAQWGYHPELGRGIEAFEAGFPADFISEAIDQTRGWFYTLMAEGVLHFDETAYRNVVCLGHLIAEDGRKMSKSLGNQFDPWEALDRQGADALRWWMLTSGSPWEPRRIGHEILDEHVRQFLLPLWNIYAFYRHVRERGGDRSRCRGAGRRGARRAGSVDPVPARGRGARRARGAGCLRRDRRRPSDPAAHRRPVHVVRPTESSSVLEPGRCGRRRHPRRVRHAARLSGDPRAAPGPLHAVRERGAVAQPRGGARRSPGLRAPLGLPRRP